MRITLKDSNAPALVAVWLANVLAYALVVYARFDVTNLAEMLRKLREAWADWLPFSALLLLVGVFGELVNAETKTRLVFWRWRHALPGCRAFSRHMYTDPRIDQDALLEHQSPLPTDPARQNALWYQWYGELRDDDRVRQIHRTYLLSRDWTSAAALILIVAGPMALLQGGWLQQVAWYVAALLLQYLLASSAARNSGVRLVQTVLACKSSEVERGEKLGETAG